MSSYAFMKYLESAPRRYDRGMRWLSRGRIQSYYEHVAEAAGAGPGVRILDIGCGTGGVSLACARRGAQVTGIDCNAGMLEVARAKPAPPAPGAVTWLELGAAEIEDRFGPGHFDAVVSCLALSEMTSDEVTYTLRMARSRLVPGGRLVVADEVDPPSRLRRWWHRAVRWPLAILTRLLTQTTTRPVRDLADRVRAAGFAGVAETRPFGPAFAIVTATAPSPESA